MIISGLTVAGAGCGTGAMSGDEIGRLAAVLSSTGQRILSIMSLSLRSNIDCRSVGLNYRQTEVLCPV